MATWFVKDIGGENRITWEKAKEKDKSHGWRRRQELYLRRR